MGNFCTNQRDRDTSLFIEKMLELQRDLVIKELDYENVQNQLSYANKQIENNKITHWTSTATSSSRKRNQYQ